MQLIFGKNHLDSNPHPSRQEKNPEKRHWMLWDLNPQPLDLKDKTLAMSYKDSDKNVLTSTILIDIKELLVFAQLFGLSHFRFSHF